MGCKIIQLQEKNGKDGRTGKKNPVSERHCYPFGDVGSVAERISLILLAMCNPS